MPVYVTIEAGCGLYVTASFKYGVTCTAACNSAEAFTTYYVNCLTANNSCYIYNNQGNIAPDGYYSNGTNCYTFNSETGITNISSCSGIVNYYCLGYSDLSCTAACNNVP